MNDISLLLTFQTQSGEKKVESEQEDLLRISKKMNKRINEQKGRTCYKPEELLKGVQVILTGHNDAEDVPPDVRVHALLACQIQHFGTELRDEE